jgi:hypothetical protein
MAGVPVKFRCYRCNTLLGVTRSKIGSVIACVKCGAELVVPEPAEATAPETSASSSSNIAEPTPAFLSAMESGMPMAFPDINPEDIRVEPGIPWEPIVTSPPPAEPRDAPPEPEPEPEPEPAPAPAEPLRSIRVVPPAEPPRPAAEPEPVVPPILIEPVKIARERPTTGRPRDLTIPRSVVAFWSLFVLLAQAWRSWRACSPAITSGGSIEPAVNL